jgi:hypothetical protein
LHDIWVNARFKAQIGLIEMYHKPLIQQEMINKSGTDWPAAPAQDLLEIPSKVTWPLSKSEGRSRMAEDKCRGGAKEMPGR